MELACWSFDFAVDVTADYPRKLEALSAYESVFSGSQAGLRDKTKREIDTLVASRGSDTQKLLRRAVWY